ncbi:hypothetical protein LUZ60_004587 [Juncus effusus]|nr:hypothetical protein LUZ60_004587 [Juncus effusus]
MAQALLTPSTLLNSRTAKSSAGALPLGTQILVSSFTRGSFSAFNVRVPRKKADYRAISSSIRCEQSAKESQKGTDVWLGRLAMVGFATAITIEVSTGKGLLENFGLATPQPILALLVTGLVVGLTAFFILQSSSRD